MRGGGGGRQTGGRTTTHTPPGPVLGEALEDGVPALGHALRDCPVPGPGWPRMALKTMNPFWLRTSVMARSQLRKHRSMSANRGEGTERANLLLGVLAVPV